jgi:hypothetical protein
MSLFYSHQNDVQHVTARRSFQLAIDTLLEFIGQAVAAATTNWREWRASLPVSLSDQEPLQVRIDQSRDPVRDARRFPLAPLNLGDKWDF